MAEAEMVLPDGTSEQPSFREALKQKNVRILAASRGASKLAMAVVSYGAMVYLAQEGATQFQISLVAASTYAAALMFGIQGGTLSDTLSKRIALVFGYVIQALLCILIPIFWGTDVARLMLIMFMTSAINQIVTPSIKSATAFGDHSSPASHGFRIRFGGWFDRLSDRVSLPRPGADQDNRH